MQVYFIIITFIEAEGKRGKIAGRKNITNHKKQKNLKVKENCLVLSGLQQAF